MSLDLGLWWARKVLGQSLSYSSMMAMGMSCPNSGFLGYPTILSQRHGHGTVSAAALLVTTLESFFTLSALLWLLQVNPV